MILIINYIIYNNINRIKINWFKFKESGWLKLKSNSLLLSNFMVI